MRFKPTVLEAEDLPLLELLRRGEIHPVVAERLPLTDARRAHGMLEQYASLGKLVLVPCHHLRRHRRMRNVRPLCEQAEHEEAAEDDEHDNLDPRFEIRNSRRPDSCCFHDTSSPRRAPANHRTTRRTPAPIGTTTDSTDGSLSISRVTSMTSWTCESTLSIARRPPSGQRVRSRSGQ
jgi:hypothetical protein